MPIDPQVRGLLDQLEARGRTPLWELTPEESRQNFLAMSALATRPDPAAPTEDRVVPGPGGDVPVRIYRPDAAETLPVVVFAHGGGWVIGDLESHDGLCQHLAVGTPALVVAVDYRRAPEHRFPAALDDVEAVVRWVADQDPVDTVVVVLLEDDVGPGPRRGHVLPEVDQVDLRPRRGGHREGLRIGQRAEPTQELTRVAPARVTAARVTAVTAIAAIAGAQTE